MPRLARGAAAMRTIRTSFEPGLRVPASLSLEIVTTLSEQQKTVRTDAMVYNELTI